VYVIETEDLVAQKLELEGSRVLLGLEQPQRVQDVVVTLALVGRILRVEESLQLLGELGSGDDVGVADVGRLESPDLDDLRFDLAKGGDEGGLVGRRRRRIRRGVGLRRRGRRRRGRRRRSG
jgi:hypothetical protein